MVTRLKSVEVWRNTLAEKQGKVVIVDSALIGVDGLKTDDARVINLPFGGVTLWRGRLDLIDKPDGEAAITKHLGLIVGGGKLEKLILSTRSDLILCRTLNKAGLPHEGWRESDLDTSERALQEMQTALRSRGVGLPKIEVVNPRVANPWCPPSLVIEFAKQMPDFGKREVKGNLLVHGYGMTLGILRVLIDEYALMNDKGMVCVRSIREQSGVKEPLRAFCAGKGLKLQLN